MAFSTLFESDLAFREFEREIQAKLSDGDADAAAASALTQIKRLQFECAEFVDICGNVDFKKIRLDGWSGFIDEVGNLNSPSEPITALQIDISWPGHYDLVPDANGLLEPTLETSYYVDGAFPFNKTSREDYTQISGTYPWAGMFEHLSQCLTTFGLSKLYGNVQQLQQLVQSRQASPAESDAARLGEAYVAVLLHQIVRHNVWKHGLPQPMAVFVGSNESAPYFHAAVVTLPEFITAGAPNWDKSVRDEDENPSGSPNPAEAEIDFAKGLGEILGAMSDLGQLVTKAARNPDTFRALGFIGVVGLAMMAHKRK